MRARSVSYLIKAALGLGKLLVPQQEVINRMHGGLDEAVGVMERATQMVFLRVERLNLEWKTYLHS